MLTCWNAAPRPPTCTAAVWIQCIVHDIFLCHLSAQTQRLQQVHLESSCRECLWRVLATKALVDFVQIKFRICPAVGCQTVVALAQALHQLCSSHQSASVHVTPGNKIIRTLASLRVVFRPSCGVQDQERFAHLLRLGEKALWDHLSGSLNLASYRSLRSVCPEGLRSFAHGPTMSEAAPAALLDSMSLAPGSEAAPTTPLADAEAPATSSSAAPPAEDKPAQASAKVLEFNEPATLHESGLTLRARYDLCRSVAEECISDQELLTLLERKPNIIAYDGFEPSGRMHIAQGVMKVGT